MKLDTPIDQTFGRGRQSWKHVVTRDWGGHKLRAQVERDSYDFQSRIYIEVWSPASLSWNRIETLDGSDYGDLPSAYEKRDDLCIAESWNVIEQMFDYAKKILS